MDEENLNENSYGKTSRLLGIFSIGFVIVFIVASVVGKRLPELFYKLIPALISGAGFVGVLFGLKTFKNKNDNEREEIVGLIISSIGMFAGICLI